LRISFAGGGSDLHDYYKLPGRYGAVVSTAINRYVYITANKKFDDLIRVSYSKTEIVERVDDLEHNIVREALKLLDIRKGIDIVYMADLPLTSAGSGLGGSSALAVGVLHALYAYKGLHVSAERLAREAVMIEREILRHPVGKQDQYSAAYGGLNYIRFNGDESVLVEPTICTRHTKEMLAKGLLLFYTGINRVSSKILEEQQRQIVDKVALHDRLVAIAEDLRERLQKNDLEAMGSALHEGWLIKRQLAAGVSNPKIDDWYERARAKGALGGKLAGAGGGGFFLFYSDEEHQAAVRAALPELSVQPIDLEPHGSRIIHVSD
jgi:D-glycero-alpha-D-manno-heptose-7-phosphate kinase